MSDRLSNGPPFRILTVVDQYTRALPIASGRYIHRWASKVATALAKAAEGIGLAQTITVDNGPEFAGKVLDEWAYGSRTELDFIQPGNPVENGYIESFNGRLRDEFHNTEIFVRLMKRKKNLKPGGL